MGTDVSSVRLPPKDTTMVEHFVKTGAFKSKSEFVRYAVKKLIDEMLLREFHEKATTGENIDKDDLNKLLAEIRTIREKVWEDYAKNLS